MPRHIKSTTKPSLAQQQFKREADINHIIARARHTGVMPGTVRQARFGDFSNSASFMEMRNLVADANQHFQSLPAKIRSRFGNDPYQVVRFIEDPENRDEAIKLGFIEKPAEKPPEPASPSPDPEANPRTKGA